MFKKITLSIIIGILATFYYAQYDAWTHKKIIQYMQKVAQESLGGTVSCTIQSMSFFSPSFAMHDVEVKSLNRDQWMWRCKRCEIHCSWLQLLFKGVLDQHMIIEGFESSSHFADSHFSIEPHIMAMMDQSFMPFTTELKSIVFKNGFLYIRNKEIDADISLYFNSSSLRIGKQIKTTVSIGDGNITHNKRMYVEKLAADVSFITEYVGDLFNCTMQLAGTCVLPHMGNEGSCYVSGVWNNDRGRFSLRNAYNSLIIDPIVITNRELRINGHFPLSYAMQCFADSWVDQMIGGIAHFSTTIKRDESLKADGHIIVEDVSVNQYVVCDVGKIIFECRDDNWKMHVGISHHNQECKGTGYWHPSTQQGGLSLKNSTDLSTKAFNYWRIKPNNFFTHLTLNQGTIKGNYEAIATNSLSQTHHCVKGLLSYQQGICITHGSIDTDEFRIEGAFLPECAIHHCSYKDKDKRELIALKASEDKKLVGSIAFPFIRSMINNVAHYDVQGEGSLEVIASVSLPHVIMDFSLKDATIRLPQTYNFIDGFTVHCVGDIGQKSVIFHDINLSLHTGNMNCLRATSYFDDKGSLLFMHAPFILDRCLLNIKKDLFAIVSGNLLLAKNSQLPAQVSGTIIIDKAQLKENLFSEVIQKQLLSYTHSVFSLPDTPLYCDLTLETKSPIVVDTGFFKTKAYLNVRVKKERHEPSISGSVVLHSGMLNFPYKPLYISKGIITFMPEQLFDPTIEFVARNKIKKYDVSLQIEGSLLTHHIALDATPPLAEEQIVGLLLVGSEENSLNSMMPALIVQNLKNLIFSNNQVSFFDKYFKPLLGTLNINLVPSFTDQTGRGGLRGALEITVDDRWRAVIQKNFSLTEDTKFELEYLFSDDITFRAIRDERRDLGGEVEMRWKF